MTRKQTSAKVSKLAAKYLAMSEERFWSIIEQGASAHIFADIRTLAASCLSQDEVKGTKPKRRKAGDTDWDMPPQRPKP